MQELAGRQEGTLLLPLCSHVQPLWSKKNSGRRHLSRTCLFHCNSSCSSSSRIKKEKAMKKEQEKTKQKGRNLKTARHLPVVSAPSRHSARTHWKTCGRRGADIRSPPCVRSRLLRCLPGLFPPSSSIHLRHGLRKPLRFRTAVSHVSGRVVAFWHTNRSIRVVFADFRVQRLGDWRQTLGRLRRGCICHSEFLLNAETYACVAVITATHAVSIAHIRGLEQHILNEKRRRREAAENHEKLGRTEVDSAAGGCTENLIRLVSPKLAKTPLHCAVLWWVRIMWMLARTLLEGSST
uniref:Uncharacterized protein n=1 Tax=Chromera velia CCMP2878 TaxID=1169474 RepID=A0A0G4H907_9ALVE|eukprot:Cvel_5919.t1-p1 / transcript=Cvel_5919.t1 / gene=Cvel_5919 / organism=Chromera_velia_CCMP2878 / gene_product=hypothetical protein / transcript_product=hypothetical protein / location=Cvel_scaffold283:35656-37422(+) / protein_length=293 / sequence_SO=supercontig / SO=protein_coding / is_pseudo=false